VEDQQIQHQHAQREQVEENPEVEQPASLKDQELFLSAQASTLPSVPQAVGLHHFVAVGFAHALLDLDPSEARANFLRKIG
jgi:hypothetical protein